MSPTRSCRRANSTHGYSCWGDHFLECCNQMLWLKAKTCSDWRSLILMWDGSSWGLSKSFLPGTPHIQFAWVHCDADRLRTGFKSRPTCGGSRLETLPGAAVFEQLNLCMVIISPVAAVIFVVSMMCLSLQTCLACPGRCTILASLRRPEMRGKLPSAMLKTTKESESRYLVFISEELMFEATDELLYSHPLLHLLYPLRGED